MIESMQTIAKQAVEMVKPAITQLAETGVLKRRDMHIVCLDPQIKPGNSWSGVEIDNDVVIYEESFGDTKNWEHDYEAIARSKANIAWRERMPSRAAHALAPQFLQEGDTVYGPGAVYINGVVVGVSGVQSFYDELIAGWIALAIIALCFQIQEEAVNQGDFYGKKPNFDITEEDQDEDQEDTL